MSVIFGLSSCDLGEKFLKSYGVEVINLELNINGNNYLYNADNFKFEQYYNLTNYSVEYNGLESLIEAKLTMALNTYQDVIILTPSYKFCPSYKLTKSIIKKLQYTYADQKIFVIDSGLISVGYASVLFETAVLNSTGIRCEDLVKKITKIIKSYQTLIIPNNNNFELFSNFNYAKSLGIKPIIGLSNNKLELLKTVKGKLNLANEVNNLINHMGLNVGDYPVGIMNGKSNLNDANKIINQINNSFDTKVFAGNYCPTLVNQIGDNALIISFHKRND